MFRLETTALCARGLLPVIRQREGEPSDTDSGNVMLGG